MDAGVMAKLKWVYFSSGFTLYIHTPTIGTETILCTIQKFISSNNKHKTRFSVLKCNIFTAWLNRTKILSIHMTYIKKYYCRSLLIGEGGKTDTVQLLKSNTYTYICFAPRKCAELCSLEHARASRHKHAGTSPLSPCIHLPPNHCLISELRQHQSVKVKVTMPQDCMWVLGPLNREALDQLQT
jgi:hypothetical protein